MPKVSIIIPIYNSEAYLDRCLKSVIGQSENDWECILINDGSKDGSGRKCDEYSEKDRRFKVFHRFNQGPSSSRNFGLDHAQGDYICFIDSDDYVGKDFLKHLLVPMISNDSIGMTVTGMQKFGSAKGHYPKEPWNRIISSKEAFDNLLGGTRVSIKGWLWNKCFRASKLHKYRMQEGLRYCEDLEMLMRMLYEQPDFKIALVGEYDYYYYIQETGNSLSHNLQNKVEMMSMFVRLLDNYPNTMAKRRRLMMNAYHQCRFLAEIEDLSIADKNLVKKARKTIRKYWFNSIYSFTISERLQITAILISFYLYRMIVKMTKK